MAPDQKKAVEEGRTVVFVDQSGFYLLPGKVRTYAPVGQTPIIRATLSRATIVAEQQRTDRVGLGSRVVVRALDEDDDELTYTLVGPGEVDPRNGKISAQSPVGRAFMDRQPGETVEVETPAGVTRYRIERIER